MPNHIVRGKPCTPGDHRAVDQTPRVRQLERNAALRRKTVRRFTPQGISASLTENEWQFFFRPVHTEVEDVCAPRPWTTESVKRFRTEKKAKRSVFRFWQHEVQLPQSAHPGTGQRIPVSLDANVRNLYQNAELVWRTTAIQSPGHRSTRHLGS